MMVNLQESILGKIPADWNINTIDAISEKVTIGLVKTMTAHYTEKGVPLIRNSNIKENWIHRDTMVYLTEKFSHENQSKQLKSGDIVTVHTGDIGTSAVIPKDLNGAQGFATLNTTVNKEIIYNKYLSWFFNSTYYKKQAYSLSTGDGRNNLNLKDFRKSLVCYPSSLKEQQKIASILSSVDETIEKTEQIIEQIEIVKKGLMQELLTKGIGHTEFKDTPVGKIPIDWGVLNFNDVFDRITTKNSVDNQNVLTISGEHGLISQLDYFNKSVSSKNLKNYIYLEKYDFAYNKSYSNGYPLGAIKRLERYDVGVVSTLYICFKLKDPYINGFYKYYFDSPYWHRQVYSIAPEGGRSHGLLNVGVKDFFEILIPVPAVEEQKRINKKLHSIDQKILIEKNKLVNLKNIKQGLMQQLLTGKKRVKVDDSEEVLS